MREILRIRQKWLSRHKLGVYREAGQWKMQADMNRDLKVSSQTALGRRPTVKHYVVRCSAVCLLYITGCTTRGCSQQGMRKEQRRGGGSATLSWQSRLNRKAAKPGYRIHTAKAGCHELAATLHPLWWLSYYFYSWYHTLPLTGCKLYAQ